MTQLYINTIPKDIIRHLENAKLTDAANHDNCMCLTCKLIKDLKSGRVSRLDQLLKRLKKVKAKMCMTQELKRYIPSYKDECNCIRCLLVDWTEQKINQVMTIGDATCKFCGK